MEVTFDYNNFKIPEDKFKLRIYKFVVSNKF